ncbi:MAG: HAD-IC family P-type ATPase [Sulfolobales archaeon]
MNALYKRDVLTSPLFSVSLAVGLTPELLPMIISINLSRGAIDMARKKVVVMRLASIQNFGNMDVICVDKTGAITENRIIVGRVIPLNSRYCEEDIVRLAVLASEEVAKDPIDNAIRQKAREINIDINMLSILEFKPFMSETKGSEAIVQMRGQEIRVIKGAPLMLLQIAANDDKESIEEIVRKLGREGLRPLAVAIENKQNTVEIVGLLGPYDRPREDSKQFIDVIKSLGVTPKIVTGDNIHVAKAISKKLVWVIELLA